MSEDTKLDAVEESAVWLELNGAPAVTWMCTPERLDELVVGWLFGEGYIDTQSEIVRMRPCTSELGFWVEVPSDKYETIERAERRRVLASGCGAVTTILGSMTDVPRRRHPDPVLDTPTLRAAVQGAVRARRAVQGHRRHSRGRAHGRRDAALSRRGHRAA